MTECEVCQTLGEHVAYTRRRVASMQELHDVQAPAGDNPFLMVALREQRAEERRYTRLLDNHRIEHEQTA